MRKLLFIWLVGVLVFLFESCSESRQVKYVFYFIGDGMGVNQVNGTEMYLAERDNVIGVKGLNFAVSRFVITQRLILLIMVLLAPLPPDLPWLPGRKQRMARSGWIRNRRSLYIVLPYGQKKPDVK